MSGRKPGKDGRGLPEVSGHGTAAGGRSDRPAGSLSGSPARRAAWELLAGLYQDRDRGRDSAVPLPVLLDRCSRKHRLDARDTGLCMALSYGVLRTERRLAHVLQLFAAKADKLPPDVRLLLLMGIYEQLFLEHIPARATINESVGLTRGKFGSRLGNLVNAVLRNVDRQADALRQADLAFMAGSGKDAGAADVARAGSLPHWLAAQWVEQYGPGGAWDMARASAARPVICWRLNLSRPDREETAARLSRAGAGREGEAVFWFAEYALPEAGGLCAELEAQGRISRQGPGSILLAERLAAILSGMPELAGKPLWDACCGRGGKSLALLERGVRVALCSDPVSARLETLAGDLRRLALPAPGIEQGGIQQLAPGKSFPLILLDVPCSGSGTLARNPELRLRLTPERAGELIALQAGILEQAWPSLERGGVLAYMTCALNREENENRVRRFATAHPDCTLLEAHLQKPVLDGQDSLFLAMLGKAR